MSRKWRNWYQNEVDEETKGADSRDKVKHNGNVRGATMAKKLRGTSVCNQPPRPTQPPTLCGTGNGYRPKCGDALWLEVKAGWHIPFVNKGVGSK